MEDDAEHADASNASPAAAGQRCEFNPAADVHTATHGSAVQPTLNRKDIPGDGRGIAWQGWLGVLSTLASMLLGLHTPAGIIQGAALVPDSTAHAQHLLLALRQYMCLSSCDHNIALYCGSAMQSLSVP